MKLITVIRVTVTEFEISDDRLGDGWKRDA